MVRNKELKINYISMIIAKKKKKKRKKEKMMWHTSTSVWMEGKIKANHINKTSN